MRASFLSSALFASLALAAFLGFSLFCSRASESRVRARAEAMESERDKWRRDYFHMEYEFRKLLARHRDLMASKAD